MATAKWFPSDCRREGTKQGQSQTAEASEVSRIQDEGVAFVPINVLSGDDQDLALVRTCSNATFFAVGGLFGRLATIEWLPGRGCLLALGASVLKKRWRYSWVRSFAAMGLALAVPFSSGCQTGDSLVRSDAPVFVAQPNSATLPAKESVVRLAASSKRVTGLGAESADQDEPRRTAKKIQLMAFQENGSVPGQNAVQLPFGGQGERSTESAPTQPGALSAPARQNVDSQEPQALPEMEGGDGIVSELPLEPEFQALPAVPDPTASSEASFTGTETLLLEQVLTSVKDCYPEIEIAIGEIETANGKVLASWGEFDRVISGHSISQPLGFYQTYRNGLGVSQPLYGGGEVYGTYRIGDGNFEPWFGERETNEAGEFKAGFSLPLLKDRNLDARRAKLLASGLKRDQVESNVESRLLRFQRFATQAYWDWVASGQAVQVQKQLLELANTRVSQIKERVASGDLAQIAQIGNEQLIAKRKNDLIKTQRMLDKAAIKLSLFWRDANCQPVIVAEGQLPRLFPASEKIAESVLAADIENAFSVRPELVELEAKRREICIDREYAENLTLPKLDVKGFAGQDIGGAASSKGDKTPFELQLGVFYEVPLERRKGLGKIRAADGKLVQIDAKIRFTSDKIRAELQDAASAVNAAYDQIMQSTENLRLTRRSLELGRILFEQGDIDLITLNIYEVFVADAELQLLDAQYKYFFYQAIYETAKIGVAFDR